MHDFTFASATAVRDAIDAGDGAVDTGHTAFLAGGTTLVDLMKLGVLRPRLVLDINALPLREITVDETGLTVGSGTRMSDLAAHPAVVRDFPLVVDALLAGASQQIRNMASIGGNLLQRTRCSYYRDVWSACNRRRPGSGCDALDGANRTHAILGTSGSCVATHPSDLAVALVASDAVVQVVGRHGRHDVPIGDFYRAPGDTPHLENVLAPGDLVTSVRVPHPPAGAGSAYVKVRDRASYEFALASAAVLLRVRDGIVTAARVAAGGVATVPWRLHEVEAALVGSAAGAGVFAAAARRATRGAHALAHNAYKIPLLERTVQRALEEAAR